jgi:Domain of unknown function (DUF5615)
MKIRFYVDEDTMSDALTQALRARAIDVLTTQEARMLGRLDEEQLRYASERGYTIYTFNTKDYTVLHKQFLEAGVSHAGIVVCPDRRLSIGEQMRRLSALSSHLSAEEMHDRLEYL